MEKKKSWDKKWKKVSDKTLGKGGQGVVYLVESRDLVEKVYNHSHGILGNSEYEFTLEKFDRFRDYINGIVAMGSADMQGALKVIKDIPYGNDKQKAEERFKIEIAILKKNLHKNLIRILDTDNESWYVSKYYYNGTLTKANSNEVFKGDVYKALKALRPLIEGVSKLQKDKIYHRDIKPDNIFLDGDNNLILGDFGIAFSRDGKPRVTGTLEKVGSWECMPPWERGRRSEKVKPTFDVYSLGKVLWSMLTGNPIIANEYRFNDDEDSLISLFPNEKYMYMVDDLLKKCVVHKEINCKIYDAEILLDEVDYIIRIIKNNSDSLDVVDENGNEFERLCKVCGVGKYKIEGEYILAKPSGNKGISGAGGRVMKALICNRCFHVELFSPSNVKIAEDAFNNAVTRFKNPDIKHD